MLLLLVLQDSIFSLTQTSGTFIRGEAIEINGTREAS